MGKVYRADRKAVQRIKARDLVPGDIAEVAGEGAATPLLGKLGILGRLGTPGGRWEGRAGTPRGAGGRPGPPVLSPGRGPVSPSSSQ